MSGLDTSLPLSRMAAGCRQTREHLDLIERQIERRATRMVLTARVKNRPFRRSVPSWTRKEERRLQETIDRLRFQRRGELDRSRIDGGVFQGDAELAGEAGVDAGRKRMADRMAEDGVSGDGHGVVRIRGIGKACRERTP